MSDSGPQPKSDAELEAELAKMDADLRKAEAEADTPDVFQHPDQPDIYDYLEQGKREAEAEKAEGEG